MTRFHKRSHKRSEGFALGRVVGFGLLHIIDTARRVTLCGEYDYKTRGKIVGDPIELLADPVISYCDKCRHNATLWQERQVLATVDLESGRITLADDPQQ